MGKVIRAVAHLSVEEIDQRIKASTEGWRIRRWMVIRHAWVQPRPAQEIALSVGLSKQSVYNLISAYNRRGPGALETPGKGRRQRVYLSLEQERSFLERLTDRSRLGELTTVREIKAELDKQVGQAVAESTVYRMLKRHPWRKVVPRPKHPKREERKQEAFKKTFPRK